MGTVINISKADEMDDPATRADFYVAETRRNVIAFREAMLQIPDEIEQSKARSQMLILVSDAIDAALPPE